MTRLTWILLAAIVALAVVGVALAVAAARTDQRVRTAWAELRLESEGDVFDPASVADLPDPARRFLLRAIESGTPLARSVELEMQGWIRLGPDREAMPFAADQILAAPRGFIWRANAGEGVMRISGFDSYARGQGEMRWAVFGLIPVVRAADEDVTRSAAGRLAMESVMLPSALVPGRGTTWEAVDDDTARFSVSVGSETVVTTLEVDADGRPRRASAMRWSRDAGPGYDLFAVELDGELRSGGYAIPARLQAGWRLGAADELRFFGASLDSAVFR